MDGNTRMSENFPVARDNGIDTEMTGGLMENGILEINERGGHGRFQNGAIDRRNLEKGHQLGNLHLCPTGAEGLGNPIEDGRNRCAAETSDDTPPFHPREELAGVIRKGLPVHRQIEDDIGVKEKFH